MTVIDQQQNSYYSICPTFVTLEPKFVGNAELKKTALPSTFSLLNWNIYKQQNKQWSAELNEWIKQADLMTLQEVKHSPRFIGVAQQYQLHYLHNIAFSHKSRFYGVNTVSKTSPLKVCGSRYSEPWSIIPKTGLASTYNIQGSQHPLLLINLHGVNFTFTSKPLKEQIRPYIQLVKKHHGPIIIAGDFNTWTDARTKEVIVALTTLGFLTASFPEDHRMTAFGLPLDHVLYRQLEVLKAESIPTDASDHSPQLVRFTLSPEIDNNVHIDSKQ